MLYSPINYAGNKSRIAKQIFELFPLDIDCIYDIFCGSGIIGIFSKSQSCILNDIDLNVLELIKYFKDTDPETIINNTDEIIKEFSLTNTYYEGRDKYPEKKHEGLSLYNKEKYIELRKSYNNDKDVRKLFTLIVYGFNHYLRFNNKGEFNVPVGKTDFVKSLRERTINYSKALKNKDYRLSNFDFRDEKLYSDLNKNDFLYFDPPYLITSAPYNLKWNDEDEKDLLNILDKLNKNGYKFALSNVIESNGKENTLLKNWMKNYNVHYIERKYLNSNYRKKNLSNAIEVLVVNY